MSYFEIQQQLAREEEERRTGRRINNRPVEQDRNDDKGEK